jgi:hypothetical protein
MVVFECGQKCQRLAHFQDDPAELVGLLLDTNAWPSERSGNFPISIDASRQKARRRMMSGLWLP